MRVVTIMKLILFHGVSYFFSDDEVDGKEGRGGCEIEVCVCCMNSDDPHKWTDYSFHC